MTGPRIGSLFSGAGGLDIAVQAVFGGTITWHCENNPAAIQVLRHRWPRTANLGNIKRVDWNRVDLPDIVTGGFPCQDVSCGGRRAGLGDDTRSGLWAYMADAIAALQPELVIIENVRGMLHAIAHRSVESEEPTLDDRSNGPVLRAIGAVLGDLADLRYDAQWCTVTASSVGAPHRRARVFIVAHPCGLPWLDFGAGGAGGSGFLTESPGLLPSPRRTDGHSGSPKQRGRRGDLMLPSAVVKLLPTPEAKNSHASQDYARADRPDSGGDDLVTAMIRAIRDETWGEYEQAIKRWEQITRPAPPPTVPNTKGNPRLNPAFAEWMMGWPPGHVTDPALGITRNEQLSIIGNGVVPLQAIAAIRHLLAVGASC